jgi:diaminohydroxyphosphoribosylaminopyrimidine deaminase / 5-amino-6-(5-phosphoribosylamino)uracil reductase
MLDLAARLGARAAGFVEPNPMVGAVIVRDGAILGMAHHQRYGGLHAEREALADCRRRAHDPRGATIYVTLEPCRHVGKQPPCTDALVEAGIARVVFARPDPNPASGGGAAVLAGAGISCELSDASPAATRLSDPFVKRTTTGLPWLIAKWAQTIDGKIATRAGSSQWVTGPLMRRRVHRLRARVDAIMVGAGTLRTDDPMLTGRDVRIRRVARRIVLTRGWNLPLERRLIRTARQVPTTFAGPRTAADLFESVRPALESAGVECLALSTSNGGPDPRRLLTELATKYGITTILVEGGSSLLGSLFEEHLVDEAIVHIAPMILGDHEALSAATGPIRHALADARRLTLCRVKRLGDELELVYRRP